MGDEKDAIGDPNDREPDSSMHPSGQVLMSGMLSEKRLAGEYELMLSADAPLHDIIQASILYRSGGGLLLSLPGLGKSIEIKANSKHSLEYEGIDRNGEVLFSENQSFTVQFMAGNQGETTPVHRQR